MTVQASKSRERFEEWAKEQTWFSVKTRFRSMKESIAWEAWQANVERCAQDVMQLQSLGILGHGDRLISRKEAIDAIRKGGE